MPPENAAVAVPTIQPPTTVAPRRARRLAPAAPRSRRQPVAAVLVPARAAADRPGPLSAVEGKVAALKDPVEILQVVSTEAALRRAQRLSGAGESQRQAIRLLSVCMLFALLAAAIGAMWWLQTSLQGSRRTHRPPPAASAKPQNP